MTDNEIYEYKETSKSMFNEVCDPDSLVSINIEAQVNDAIIKQFIATKASKSDFEVLVGLMEFWSKSTSTITLESYDAFRAVTMSRLANANLSRAIKNLREYGFISKTSDNTKLEYAFHTAYSVLNDS